jgi:transposase-like protein
MMYCPNCSAELTELETIEQSRKLLIKKFECKRCKRKFELGSGENNLLTWGA